MNGQNNVHRNLILKRHGKFRRKRSTRLEDNSEINVQENQFLRWKFDEIVSGYFPLVRFAIYSPKSSVAITTDLIYIPQASLVASSSVPSMSFTRLNLIGVCRQT